MKCKYVADRGRQPSPMMSVEVWEVDHCALPLEQFPYNPEWWKENKCDPTVGAPDKPISQTFEDALRLAKQFYNSLPYPPARKTQLLLGRIDHLKWFESF